MLTPFNITLECKNNMPFKQFIECVNNIIALQNESSVPDKIQKNQFQAILLVTYSNIISGLFFVHINLYKSIRDGIKSYTN